MNNRFQDGNEAIRADIAQSGLGLKEIAAHLIECGEWPASLSLDVATQRLRNSLNPSKPSERLWDSAKLEIMQLCGSSHYLEWYAAQLGFEVRQVPTGEETMRLRQRVEQLAHQMETLVQGIERLERREQGADEARTGRGGRPVFAQQ